jgi:hypothetical protein
LSGSFELDINNDGENDFIISHSIWTRELEVYSPHHWGDKYRNFTIDITALNGNQINVSENQIWGNDYLINYLDSTNIISENSNWAEYGYICYSSLWSMESTYEISNSKYIGIKINFNNMKYYGWIGINVQTKDLSYVIWIGNESEALRPDQRFKEIMILDWAVNLTEGNDVIPGQKE